MLPRKKKTRKSRLFALTYPAQERRRSPRLNKNIPIKLCSDHYDVVTETWNLSCIGAYCQVDKYFEPMTKLKIHLLLPLKKGDKILTRKVSCRGVVVRAESQPQNQNFNIAIFFNDIHKRDSKIISDFIDALLAKA